jgi:type VI secretion system protein ImpH
MATASGRNPPVVSEDASRAFPSRRNRIHAEFMLPPPNSLADKLFKEGHAFSFFQAVYLMERLFPDRLPVARGGVPMQEVVRFRAHQSLSFPPSSIYVIDAPRSQLLPPAMEVTFMGLTGPSGVLPRHYTEMIVKLYRDARGPERTALRDWLDLFNHRIISLFYRSWGKYRVYFPYQRGEFRQPQPDLFTQGLYCLTGMGMPSLRNRLRVSCWDADAVQQPQRRLAQIEDLSMVYYSGLLTQKPRSAAALQALLQDYFRLPIEVQQFRGQWLLLEPANQSQLGETQANNQLGMNTVAGERIWDVVGRIRLRIGPLNLEQFIEFIPDRAPQARRKSFFVLVHWVRFFVGPELTFEVNVVLDGEEVPECRLEDQEEEVGACLGWNTWLKSQEFENVAEDAVFEGEDVVWVN